MFSKKPEDALETKFNLIEKLYDGTWSSDAILQCKECGCYVVNFSTEECLYLPGEDWDNTHYYETYLPIEEVEAAKALYAEKDREGFYDGREYIWSEEEDNLPGIRCGKSCKKSYLYESNPI